MHAAIEHAERRTSIYVPSQWDTIVNLARSKRPYIVVPMCFSQFYDLHLLAKEGYGNFTNLPMAAELTGLSLEN